MAQTQSQNEAGFTLYGEVGVEGLCGDTTLNGSMYVQVSDILWELGVAAPEIQTMDDLRFYLEEGLSAEREKACEHREALR